mmetsp:Transcript_8314/g.18160  ORF Transcript_8314/g.18160 Transcript_8314/m.18160 type:complete len:254 (-) Transcript_8314:160-921(-)|eukprot:CAMPEP_0170592344 /NCGR_PEP_ID=MMETSP0224-20130122/12875_1 /TAXON_ID=285029 /ORGANISM="Togula jolla, Strain CCCM 725" /LENGTH=253 /DNA_ID=CAMNT_0010916245 /DNA_START=103 /DNA_END=864 /DNA_ORIENTATION=-
MPRTTTLRRALSATALAVICPFVLHWQPSLGFAQVSRGPAATHSRVGRVVRLSTVSASEVAAPVEAEAKAEAEVAAPSFDKRLIGWWRYSGGAYELRETAGKLFFREGNLAGELSQQDEWLVATLPNAGTIQLKLTPAGQVMSQFKAVGSQEWGAPITAISEWSSLTTKTKILDRELDTREFKGETEDGAVAVVVNGHQRPTSIKLSPEAAKSADLGDKVLEAHSKAVQESNDYMTERLRELYAAHFSGRPDY